MSPKPTLSSALIDQVLFAMEDQENHSVFHLDSFSVVLLEDENQVAEERVLPLPSWTSSDGFRMMRDFTGSLHHPSIEAELNAVLDSGQGVFRRFKQILKPRDFLYRQWLRFKRRFMEDVVLEWLDAHPDEFGPDGRNRARALEPSSLLATDFTTHPGDSADLNHLEVWDQEASREASVELFGAQASERYIGFLRRGRGWKDGDRYWVAVNPEGEWAGVVWVRPWIPEGQARVLEILLWFVDPVYRGLGLGALLLQEAVCAAEVGQPVFLSSPQGGQRMDSVLTRAGFTSHGKLWSLIP